MLCGSCGESISDGAKFCKYCGAKIASVPPGFSLDKYSGLYYQVEKKQSEQEQVYWEVTAWDSGEGTSFLIYPSPQTSGEDGSPRGYRFDQEEQMYYHTLRLIDEEQGPGVLVSYLGAAPGSAGQEFFSQEESASPPLQNTVPSPPIQPPMPTAPAPTIRQLRPAPPPPPLPPGAILLENGQYQPNSRRTTVTCVLAVLAIVAALVVGAWQFGLFSRDDTPSGFTAPASQGEGHEVGTQQADSALPEAADNGQENEAEATDTLADSASAPAGAVVLETDGYILTVPEPIFAYSDDGSVIEEVNIQISECFVSGAGFNINGEIENVSGGSISCNVMSYVVDNDGNEAVVGSIFGGQITLEPGERRALDFRIPTLYMPDTACTLKLIAN